MGWGTEVSRAVLPRVMVAASALVLAGCAVASGQDPTPSPTTASPEADPLPATPSSSPSASPATDAPLTDADLLALLPEDAQYPDIRGAMAVAVWFMEYRDDIYKGADLRPWVQLSSKECGYCSYQLEDALDYRVPGVVIEGGEVVVDPDSVTGYLGESGNAYVFFDVTFSSFVIELADGSSEQGSAETHSATFKLELIDELFVVAEVMFDAEQE